MAALARSMARSCSSSNSDATAAPPSATKGTLLTASNPMATASRCAPQDIASEIEPSTAGRAQRSVGIWTSRLLYMAALPQVLAQADVARKHAPTCFSLTHVKAHQASVRYQPCTDCDETG